jgi:acyl-CoA ligase (AMP-forming) (exosortase A-associated)
MPDCLFELIRHAAENNGDRIALIWQSEQLTYAQLEKRVQVCAKNLIQLGVQPLDRVAVCLNKSIGCVVSLFAVSLAGATIVPVNILLKPDQVEYLLGNCAAGFLITSSMRLQTLESALTTISDLTVINLDRQDMSGELDISLPFVDKQSPAAIFYTSGSTGQPKGVVLSHSNLILGADSVCQYLHISPGDRLLAVLPLQFDYGFNQITSAFYANASVVLMDYLFPQDVIRVAQKHKVTGLACVPPLLHKLAELDWPESHLRYLTNSGGHLPVALVDKIRRKLPGTELYLMYGLTESFRSTYLPPALLNQKPWSVGQAIPYAEVFILRPNGVECEVDEIGELVHAGPMVAIGYWHNELATQKRFKQLPTAFGRKKISNRAVWSGDLAKRDSDGDITILGRNDSQIKVSGYRISPTEIEDVVYRHEAVSEAVVVGLPDDVTGQKILLVVTLLQDVSEMVLQKYCQRHLPNYMLPKVIDIRKSIPKTQTGKYDREMLMTNYGQEPR